MYLLEDSCLARNEAEIHVSRFVSRSLRFRVKAIKNTLLEQTMSYNTKHCLKLEHIVNIS